MVAETTHVALGTFAKKHGKKTRPIRQYHLLNNCHKNLQGSSIIQYFTNPVSGTDNRFVASKSKVDYVP